METQKDYSLIVAISIALVLVSSASILAYTWKANAEAANHPTAEAAAQWLRDNAETHDAWKDIEAEWNRQKKIVTEDMGCTLTADRYIIECTPEERPLE